MKLTSRTLKTTFAITLTLLVAGTATAVPELDAVSYDPVFISAGDRVNISANLHETQQPYTNWDEDKKLGVVLKPGNRLTEEYVTIEDARDRSIGFLYPDGVWNQNYQVNVDSGAPTGRYDFELHIQYLEDGEPVKIPTRDGGKVVTYIEEFSMPVDQEGVDISSNVIGTEPSVPRPGDNSVQIKLSMTNTGNKPVEEITLKPGTPLNVQTSYSSDEKFFIDRLNSGDSAERTLSVDLDSDLEPGLKWVYLNADYEDTSGNPYAEELKIPLRVEGRSDLELVNSSLKMKAGATSELHLKVRNTGSQDAESVTARVLAERSQPFSLNDRSSYIGEIKPNQTAEAVLKVSADRNTALREHQLNVQLRSTGDSEEGDNSVYTATDQVKVELDGRTRNPLIYAGVTAAALILGLAAFRY
jgi:hypothetical protein